MTIGVYRILCAGKFYIGSSVDIEQRVAHHLSALRDKRHHCKALQKHFDAQPAFRVSHEIMVICETADEALDQEQAWLDRWHSAPECLNDSARARDPLHDPAIQERRLKHLKASAKHKQASSAHLKAQWTDEGFRRRNNERIAKQNADKEFSAKTRERFLTMKNDPEMNARLLAGLAERNRDPEFRARQAAAVTLKVSKAVVRVSLETDEEMLFASVTKAAEFMRGGPSMISRCCKGKTKTAYGYAWKFQAASSQP